MGAKPDLALAHSATVTAVATCSEAHVCLEIAGSRDQVGVGGGVGLKSC